MYLFRYLDMVFVYWFSGNSRVVRIEKAEAAAEPTELHVSWLG